MIFHVGLLFYQLFVFQTGHRKMMRIFTWYQPNVPTLTPFIKEDKILKSV